MKTTLLLFVLVVAIQNALSQFIVLPSSGSLNGLTVTPTNGTLTLANGKTLTVGNTLTLSGIDASTLNIGSGGTLGTAAYATIANYLPLTGGTLSGAINGTDVRLNDSLIAVAGTFGGKVSGTYADFNSFNAASSGWFYWNSRSIMYSPSNGTILFTNTAETDFSRLMLGGTTSSFPSLKRSGTSLLVRLADDSGDAGFGALSFTSAAPSGSTARPWKFGDLTTVTLTSPNKTVAIDVNGTVVYLQGKLTND